MVFVVVVVLGVHGDALGWGLGDGEKGPVFRPLQID